MWLITVNIAQRCSNTRTDPQNDDAKHSGKLHDLCRITELVQRELRSCESRLTNFANPVRNPPPKRPGSPSNVQRLLLDVPRALLDLVSAGGLERRRPLQNTAAIGLKRGRTSAIAALENSQDALS